MGMSMYEFVDGKIGASSVQGGEWWLHGVRGPPRSCLLLLSCGRPARSARRILGNTDCMPPAAAVPCVCVGGAAGWHLGPRPAIFRHTHLPHPPALCNAIYPSGPKGEGGLDDATGASGAAGGASYKQTSATVDLSE